LRLKEILSRFEVFHAFARKKAKGWGTGRLVNPMGKTSAGPSTAVAAVTSAQDDSIIFDDSVVVGDGIVFAENDQARA
jgi:hypothetical protein